MQKAIKYIAVSLAMTAVGITMVAKHTPGIPPVWKATGPVKEAKAWQDAPRGETLRELDRLTPGMNRQSLVQTDGIIDFRPDQLTGFGCPESSASFCISHLPIQKIPGGSNLCGFIGYNLRDMEMGMYRLPINANQETTLLRGTFDLMSNFHGGAATDRYYVTSYYGRYIQNGVDQCLTAIFDKNDWSLIAEAGDYGEYERVATDMTYDPTTNRIYGCFLNHDQDMWTLAYMQVDDMNPAKTIQGTTVLCKLDVALNGLAADKNGVLWGIRQDNGKLVTINKKSGAMTPVASTGLVPGYSGSMNWDNTNGILYWCVTYNNPGAQGGMSSAILTVDTATGALTRVHDYPSATQTMGIYNEFTALPRTPGLVSEMKVNFVGESLSGNVTFDAPATLTDGNSASGKLEYSLSVVKDNGFVAHKGNYSCEYGQKNVVIPVELANQGEYTFTVQPFNSEGVGYPVSKTLFIGRDMPQQAQNLLMTYETGTINVTWDKVEATLHGGYFDPAKVSYKVSLVRLDADGETKAYKTVNVTDTSASWEVGESDDLLGYRATVIPVFDKNEGEPAVSEYKWYGSLKAPFVQKMTAATDGWIPSVPEKGAPWEKTFSSKGNGWSIPYNWGNPNDAWLFSPAITLEKGRYYTMSYKVWAPIVAHTVKVWIGRGQNVGDMQTKLAETTVTGATTLAKAKTITFGFECTETGIYHLGFHNDTNSDTWTNSPYMWINDVTCSAAPDIAPAAPSLDVDYDQTGLVAAKITIVAPTTTFAGEEVDKIDNIVLKSNGIAVNEWNDIEAGTELTYDYEGAKKGMFEFMAQATVDGVAGVPAIANYYLGMQAPVDPAWVSAEELEDIPGTVEITWDPVNTVANGQQVDESVVKYNVMNLLTNSYLEKDVEDSEYMFTACEPDKQCALLLSVNAKTEGGGTSSTYGTRARQSLMHVGTSYELPLRETFADGFVHYSWSVVNQYSAYDGMTVVRTASQMGDKDANGDGCCLMAFVPFAGSQCSLYSGRIHVPEDAGTPVFGFAVYNTDFSGNISNDNENAVLVSIIGSKNQGSLKPVVCKEQNFGWQYYYYDLSMFKGQEIHIMFTFQTNSYTTHFIDDVQFFDAPASDLAVTMLTGPATAVPGKKVELHAAVFNLGTNAVAKNTARVEIYRNGDSTPILKRNVPALQPFQSTDLLFGETLNTSFDKDVTYRAEVIYDKDMDSENNSAEVEVALSLPDLPAPRGLAGERTDNGRAFLSWEAPDLTPDYQEIKIDFEHSVAPSMTDLGGFVSLDIDGNDIDPDLGTGSWGFTSYYHPNLARSGDWMVVSMCNAGGAAKEDWLVSPKLSGEAQTVVFYARTYWNAYETFKVLTSFTGCDKGDFTATALEYTTSSNDWKRIEVEVPAGTEYFAIVAKAEDTSDMIYLMFDDFEFAGADKNEGLVVKNYNAYRDNKLVNTEAIPAGWVDEEGNAGPHFYRITASYEDRGESPASNEVFLFTRGSGIDNIKTIEGKLWTRPGAIVVEGAAGCRISVSDLSGVVMASTDNARDCETMLLSPGIYVVTIDGASVKITVK